jgi:hypothetical protein
MLLNINEVSSPVTMTPKMALAETFNFKIPDQVPSQAKRSVIVDSQSAMKSLATSGDMTNFSFYHKAMLSIPQLSPTR